MEMIDTRGLKEGDIVTVYLADDESERIGGKAKCRFVNGLFRNIENNHHKGEVYGSSVVRIKMVNENKLGMSLGGECPGCGAGKDGFCDWVGHYTNCHEYKKIQAEKAEVPRLGGIIATLQLRKQRKCGVK